MRSAEQGVAVPVVAQSSWYDIAFPSAKPSLPAPRVHCGKDPQGLPSIQIAEAVR